MCVNCIYLMQAAQATLRQRSIRIAAKTDASDASRTGYAEAKAHISATPLAHLRMQAAQATLRQRGVAGLCRRRRVDASRTGYAEAKQAAQA